jgi:hypothetical protein
MTLDDVRRRLDEIRARRNDPEVAHMLQDELYRDVLAAIAIGICEDPKALADEACKAMLIPFVRWYA